MAKVNVGQDKQARLLAGTGTVVGYGGTATATSTTTLTATGTPWSVNVWAGRYVVTTATPRYGVIISNTSSVLTIDKWYDPTAPTGAAGSTPGSTSTFIIFGEAPIFYMALTADATAPANGDTTLPSEITTAAGGLKRQAAAYAHTTSATTYTLTGSYTANGSDSLPVTIAKIGTFDSLTPATGIILHETSLSATATLTATGDALTVTQTVTM
jgi:hypothetical protein